MDFISAGGGGGLVRENTVYKAICTTSVLKSLRDWVTDRLNLDIVAYRGKFFVYISEEDF